MELCKHSDASKSISSPNPPFLSWTIELILYLSCLAVEDTPTRNGESSRSITVGDCCTAGRVAFLVKSSFPVRLLPRRSQVPPPHLHPQAKGYVHNIWSTETDDDDLQPTLAVTTRYVRYIAHFRRRLLRCYPSRPSTSQENTITAASCQEPPPPPLLGVTCSSLRGFCQNFNFLF